jgi:uncharacterized membrane protein
MQLIIPNWHPIFVHFTVALLLIATGLFLVNLLFPAARWREQCKTVALWNLWLGVTVSLITVATGVYAFNTVTHDDPSHVIMTEHRNLALTTLGIFLVLAVLAWRKNRKQAQIGWLFAVGMLLGGSVLASTAWHGGELVYRHGLGVMSLPNADHHHHSAAGSHNHDEGHNDAHDHDDHQTHNDVHSDAPTTMEHKHDPDVTNSGAASQVEAENDPDPDPDHEHEHEHEHEHQHEHDAAEVTHVHPDGTVHTHTD